MKPVAFAMSLLACLLAVAFPTNGVLGATLLFNGPTYLRIEPHSAKKLLGGNSDCSLEWRFLCAKK